MFKDSYDYTKFLPYMIRRLWAVTQRVPFYFTTLRNHFPI